MMLTAFSISSIESRMPTALLRDSAPYIPMQKRMTASTRKCCRPTGTSTMALLLSRDHDRADQPDGQQDRRDPERQHVRVQQQHADPLGRLDVQAGRAQVPR